MKNSYLHASAAPEIARRTASCVKFLTVAADTSEVIRWRLELNNAPCSMRKKPQRKMFTPRCFPTGNLCMRKLVRKAQTKKPK